MRDNCCLRRYFFVDTEYLSHAMVQLKGAAISMGLVINLVNMHGLMGQHMQGKDQFCVAHRLAIGGFGVP